MLARYRGLIVIGLVLAILYGGVIYFHFEKTRQMAVDDAIERINHMLFFNRALRSYVEDVQKPAVYDMQKDWKISPDFFNPEILSATYITRHVFMAYKGELMKAGHPEYTYRLAAINPLNPANKASEKEAEIIRRVNEQQLESHTEIYMREGRTYLVHAIPIEPNRGSCLLCHGEPKDAPGDIIKRYGTASGFHESIGQVRAIISIEAPLDEEIARSRRTFIAIPVSVSIAFGLVFVMVWLHFSAIWAREDEIGRKNRALTEKVEESERLLKEIHHRVKNNLMVVEGLMKLQPGGTADARMREAMAETEGRVRAMSLVHEQLYKASDLKQLDFQAYLRALATAIVRNFWITPTHVALVVDVPQVQADVDTVIPCGLIVNELMTNALRHAFPGGKEGTITVSLSAPEGRQWVLSVRDDGSGIPDWIEPETTKSMGMKIITTLAEQLKGTVEIIRSPLGRPGTEVRLTFLPEKAD